MLRRIGLMACVMVALAPWAAADDEAAHQAQPGATPMLSPDGPPISDAGDAETIESGEPIDEGSYEDEPGFVQAQTRFVAQEPNPGEPLGFSGAQFAPRPGLAVDPGLAPELVDAPYMPSYFDPADPDSPAPLISSGEWLRNGRWYTEQSVIYWQRLAGPKNKTPLGFEFISALNPHANTLDAQIDMGYQPGLRSTVGRYIGRDSHNRDHSLEFTYIGLGHWQFGKSITAQTPGTIFQLVDPLATVPVFNGSDTQAVNQTSDFNSYEFNYRIDRRLGRDRLLYTRDSSWVRQATPSLLCSMFTGVRVAIVNERLDWTASNTLGNGQYLVTTHNNMVGPQVGADLMYEHTYWRAGVRSSAGALVNWDSASNTVRILDTNGTPLSPNRDEFRKNHSLSFVGGLNFIGEYRFRPNFGIRCSYDMLWVTGLALAQDQLTFFPSNPPTLSDSHSLFFQGFSLGFEWFR